MGWGAHLSKSLKQSKEMGRVWLWRRREKAVFREVRLIVDLLALVTSRDEGKVDFQSFGQLRFLHFFEKEMKTVTDENF